MSRRSRRIVLALGLTIGAAGLALAGFDSFVWSRLPYYQPASERDPSALALRPDDEMAAVFQTFARPYVVELTADSGGALLLYGAEHTKDPDDPQIADITARWSAFGPTVALCESRLGTMFVGLMDPVRTFSEPGAVHALARRARIPTYTWEPTEDHVTERLLQVFEPEQVALSFVLRSSFSNLRFGPPDDPNAFVLDTLRDRTQHPALAGTIRSIEDVDRIWARDFPEEPDWRETSDEWGLPGYLGDIGRMSNRARDEHFAHVVLELMERGERVFAVAGSSHAVRLEPALVEALGE